MSGAMQSPVAPARRRRYKNQPSQVETKDFGKVGCLSMKMTRGFDGKPLAKPLFTASCFLVEGGYLNLSVAGENPKQVRFDRSRVAGKSRGAALGIPLHGSVAVYRFQGESREAYGDVFGAACGGRGILDPFTLVGDDCLAGGDIQFAAFVLYPQSAFQDDGEFVELRVCPGSSQPCGLRMWATLTPEVLVLTRPMNSSISFGLVPAARMRVG